jgi:hypothetical protein
MRHSRQPHCYRAHLTGAVVVCRSSDSFPPRPFVCSRLALAAPSASLSLSLCATRAL